MVNVTITAEDFSQLYASLETLEVKQIVTTLMEIAPLRDEIKKRVTPRKVSILYVKNEIEEESSERAITYKLLK